MRESIERACWCFNVVLWSFMRSTGSLPASFQAAMISSLPDPWRLAMVHPVLVAGGPLVSSGPGHPIGLLIEQLVQSLLHRASHHLVQVTAHLLRVHHQRRRPGRRRRAFLGRSSVSGERTASCGVTCGGEDLVHEHTRIDGGAVGEDRPGSGGKRADRRGDLRAARPRDLDVLPVEAEVGIGRGVSACRDARPGVRRGDCSRG